MHLMIDLETLSLDPTCVVTQIGAVLFDESKTIQRYMYRPNAEEQIKKGRTVSFSAFSWWLMQGAEARQSMATASKETVIDCLLSFIQRIEDDCGWKNITHVWSNGLLFDVVIMENLFRQYRFDIPWHYRAPRDMKTLCYLIPGFVMEKPETAHDALSDAVAQAKSVMKALAIIGNGLEMLKSGAKPNAV